MTQSLHIAVVGCGFAGAAAALLLDRDGHRVTVFEAVAEPGPIGAGIVIQPTGAQVLAELGLLSEIRARAAVIERLRCQNHNDRQVFSLAYARLPGANGQLTGLGVHRGVLFETLFQAVKRSTIDVHCGVMITDRNATGQLVDDAGRHHGKFDLVVVADGARSELHHLVGGSVRSPRYPYGALWAVAPHATDIGAPDFGPELFQRVRDTAQMMGFLPTGMGPASLGDDTPLMSFFWSIAARDIPAWRATDLERWRAQAIALDPRAAHVLRDVRTHDDLLFAAYHDTVMRRWDFGDMVFIGDAAHAMSPQLGQGTNLALTDASVLARTLRSRGSDSLADSLASYTRARRRHTRFYQFASRWLTPFFQSGFTPLSWPRDHVLPHLTRVPWFERQMLETLAGVKEGVFRTRPLVPQLPAGQPEPPLDREA